MVDEYDWMAEMMVNMMMVFADAERKIIRLRVQEGLDAPIDDGKRVGRPPFGYTVEDSFLQQVPTEYVRAQNFIREVRKGREKRATTNFFEIPPQRCGVSSREQKPIMISHLITISGDLTGLRSRLARKLFHRLLIRSPSRSHDYQLLARMFSQHLRSTNIPIDAVSWEEFTNYTQTDMSKRHLQNSVL